ncbi:MAG: DUF1669 domain-containing protein [Myxococcales bacterium]|nr:DUF1669 domain-containing protein [Myxococcales bacterium]
MSGIRPSLVSLLGALALMATACATERDIEDGEHDSFGGGKADGALADGTPEARGVLALVNDLAVDVDELDHAAGLSSRAAKNIIAHRDRGPGVEDDDRFDDLAELDAVPYIGPAALAVLVDYARETGRIKAPASIDVVFSPQPSATAHTQQVAAWIRGAQRSVDIAMYSLSDAEVSAALADAVTRGVAVRFLFETAAADRKLDLARRLTSKSGKLEAMGVDVRWVNKVLHHKLAIIDGPRDDVSRAATTRLVTGSGNWSYGGTQIYDENTLFIEGSDELAIAYQREFDLLWDHSADFALAEPLPYVRSTADLATAAAAITDDPDAAALFTSANYTVADGSTTFRIERTRTTVADALVAAIAQADRSIYIASGHLRLRPVAEALIARKQARPDLDVRVYLDQQEYISASGHTAQLADLEACLAGAATPATIWNCQSRDFLFGKLVGEAAIPVRYKTYAYRWDVTYAVQMHNKFMIVDGTDLYTGSYNLSMNAEQSTFENIVHLNAASYGAVIAAYTREFERLWSTGRAPDRLAALRATIATASSVPLMFEPMALDHAEVTALKALIRSRCPSVDSTDFRTNPAAHRTCTP